MKVLVRASDSELESFDEADFYVTNDGRLVVKKDNGGAAIFNSWLYVRFVE